MFLDFQYEIVINKLDDSETRKCSESMNLKFDDKLYELANKKLEFEYMCTIPFLPTIVSNNTGKPTVICQNLEVGKKAMEKYLDIESTMLGQNIPCSRMDISFGMPAITNGSSMPGGSIPFQGYGYDNTSFVMLYFKTDIKVKHIVWDYDLRTLVGDIGGYTGLLVGFPIARGIIWTNSIILNFIIRIMQSNKFTKEYSSN